MPPLTIFMAFQIPSDPASYPNSPNPLPGLPYCQSDPSAVHPPTASSYTPSVLLPWPATEENLSANSIGCYYTTMRMAGQAGKKRSRAKKEGCEGVTG